MGAVLIGGYALFNDPGNTSSPSGSGYIRTDNPPETRTQISTGEADKDCSDFSTQLQPQTFFRAQGGPASDPHNLDRNRDGKVCESLP